MNAQSVLWVKDSLYCTRGHKYMRSETEGESADVLSAIYNRARNKNGR